jgi:hypothetical protein
LANATLVSHAMRRKYFSVVFSILTLLVAAQSAVASYAVYVDSVQAGPGEDVAVRFYLTNEKALTSLSVPIAYDPALVTLKSISFSGSRAQHLANKIVKPSDLSIANGHFLVAAFQWLEDPIAAGDGLLFTAMFNVNTGATPGSSTLLDTLFYSPGGYLEVTRVDTPGGILPEFRRGRILVGEINRAPIFTIIPDQYALEGDSLKLTVQVTDPNNDYITIAATSKPLGALFHDNGNGTAGFVWTPAYVGPNSADGSPVKVRFWAGDGDLSSQMDVTVHVINRNRRPQITAPTTVAVEAGETLDFSLSAVDPDFEAVYWSWSGLPHGATFDAANPGKLTWSSVVTDTGSYTLQFVATDTQGLADTALVSTSVQAVALYTLKLDSVVTMPGETMSYNVVLDNKLPVSGFNLLIHYDPTVLTYLSLTNTGTRAASFEYFNVTRNYNSIAGDLRIVGIADLNGSTSALAAGEGSIAQGQFRVSGDLSYAGMSVPFWFTFHDTPVNDDNTLLDANGVQIEQSEIVYINGNIMIQDIGDIRIGDINLNNIAAEIGDIIYFTNFFVNPKLYKFTLLQYANSDINQDGMTATVADLVSLINWVVSGTQPFAKISSGNAATGATLETASVSGAVTFSSECSSDIGAAYVVIETAQELTPDMLTVKVNNMTVDLRQDDGEVKVLLYSLDGDVVPSGRTELFTIAGLTDFKVAHVELGSADGRYLEVSTAAAVELPTGYELSQNYPNPFNPETTIEFSLPSASQVELTVLNVLGQQVVSLVNGDCAPGVHRVVWSGKDGDGRAVASGIYLYRLSTGSTVMTRKMMLLK